MMTIEEIVAAARSLSPAQFLQLRRKLDRLEQKVWEAELAQASRELAQADLTDKKIDQLVLRRRREGRS
jgi:hypothetical protein